jgi:hypothetical protein
MIRMRWKINGFKNFDVKMNAGLINLAISSSSSSSPCTGKRKESAVDNSMLPEPNLPKKPR